jgi:hypothetical protein
MITTMTIKKQSGEGIEIGSSLFYQQFKLLPRRYCEITVCV